MNSMNVAARQSFLLKSVWKCTPIITARGLHESSLPAGRGGRSSFSGISATVFGGTGNLGRGITNRLCKIGSGITLPHRGRDEATRPLQLMGDLGQIQFVPFSIKQSDDEIRRLIEYSNCVVNAIGYWGDLNHYSMEEVNHEWPTRLARLVAEKNDGTRLIHVGYLNSHQEGGRKVSKLLDQHHRTEIEMRKIYPETTIARCSHMFGYDCYYTKIFISKGFKYELVFYGAAPLLYDAGKSTIVRPCYVGDVAGAITKMAQHLDAPGKTFELMGSESFTLHDFVQRLCEMSGFDNYLFNTLGPIDRSKANLLQKFIGWRVNRHFERMPEPRLLLPRAIDMISNQIGTKFQWTSKDYFNMIHVSDIGTGCLGFEDLGIQPRKWDEMAYRLFAVRDAVGMKGVWMKEKVEWEPTRKATELEIVKSKEVALQML